MTTDQAATRTTDERIAAALERIALAVEAICTGIPEPAEEPCGHPDECRVEFRTMGKPVRWICSEQKGGCGYRHGIES